MIWGIFYFEGKVFIIGGGVVNFFDVVVIFKGIIWVFKEYKEGFVWYNVKIWVWCVGFNY